MELSEVISLFRKVRQKHELGDMSHLLIYDDGSGELVSEDDTYMDSYEIFEFNTIEDLVNKLNRKLKE
jgi:hypothetical protein